MRVKEACKKADAKRRPAKKNTTKDAKPELPTIEELEAAAGDLVSCCDILGHFGAEVENAGLVGETNNAKLLYLALTSRLFEWPVSIAIKGVSSGGKSFTVEQVLKFFPLAAYFERTGLSEKALAYSEEDFRHRHIIIYEAAGMNSDFGSYLIRSLLSEGRLLYEFVEKTKSGIRARLIDKPGPTGLITTTTAPKLHPENETRLLSLGVIDTPEQTKAVMRALAADDAASTINYSPWHALQAWLAAGEHQVDVPFARKLADLIPPIAVRLRRDFKLLLTLIRAHALLHRATRGHDNQGRIIATVADYEAVRELVAKLFAEGIEATVPKTIRETVAAVAAGIGEVSLASLAQKMKLDKSAVHHRVKKAIDRGYLVNREEKRGMPARIATADPLPDEIEILPDPDALEDRCSVEAPMEGIKEEEVEEDDASEPEQPETLLPPDPHLNTSTPPVCSAPFYDPGPIPESLRRAPNGTGREGLPPGQARARVSIKELWPPSLGPAGDDIFDIAPSWRQRSLTTAPSSCVGRL